MAKRILFSLILLIFYFASYSQRPILPRQSFPTIKNNNWIEHGFIQSDSGFINAVRDTNFTPKFAGTEVLWQHAGVDTAKWLWTGAKWVKPIGSSAGGSGNPNTNLGTAYRIGAGGNNIKTLRTKYGLIGDTATTGEIGFAIDTGNTGLIPRPLTITGDDILTYDGFAWQGRQIDLQFVWNKGNQIRNNGWAGTLDGDQYIGQDSGNINNAFFFGRYGIKNTYLSDNTGVARMLTVTNGIFGYQNIPSGGGGGATGKVYPGIGLYQQNDSTIGFNRAYTDGLYPQLAVQYNNPTWLNTLAYEKLTGVPNRDFGNGDNQANEDRSFDLNGHQLDINDGSVNGLLLNSAARRFRIGFEDATNLYGINGEFHFRNATDDKLVLTSDGIINIYNGISVAQNEFLVGGINGFNKVNAATAAAALQPYLSTGSGRTYYAQEPIYKSNDSTFAIRQASSSQAGVISASDYNNWNGKANQTDLNTTNSNVAANTTAIAKKEDIFSVVAYSNTLRFGTNKESLPHNQSGAETFTLATDSQYVGKIIHYTIVGDGSNLTFPNEVRWERNIKPQNDKTNDIWFTFRADGLIDAKVSTQNQNYSNLIYLSPGQSSFTTYAGFDFSRIYVPNPTGSAVNFSIGTTPGGTDVFSSEPLGANTITPCEVRKKFDAVTTLYLTGVCNTCVPAINNPSLNNN